MNKLLDFSEFVNERTSGEIYQPKRNEWMIINPKKYPELSTEFYDLIKTAYDAIGGHAKVNKPGDVFKDKDWNYWVGVDLHNSPDFDLIVWGSKTKYGVKFSGVGHDGSNEAKREYLKSRANFLKSKGYYGEISGKLAEILMNMYDLPVVNKQSDVEKILGKEIEWHGQHPSDPGIKGDGWYTRVIGKERHTKILVGNPK